MAKKKNNINAQREALIQRTSAYEQAIKQSFANTVNKVLKLNKTLPTLGQGEMFSFYSLSAKKQKEVESIFRELQSVVTFAIRKGVEIEWSTANNECDAFISSTFGQDLSKSKEVAAWYERNTDAMEAFINRSDNGLNLSDRIWKNVQQLRDEMEVAMTVSIGEGGSAATTSRKVRQYLNDPDLMFKRFRFKKGEEDILDEDGNVIGKKPIWGKKWKKRVKDEKTGKYKFIDYDRDSYKVGRGIYKSAARNAMRVARTETTMAYRQADHERWQQLDFVIGQEVKLSDNHPADDICNTLAGKYPKNFNFCGWHPQCFCYVVPITLSTDESLKIANEIANGRDYEPLLNDFKQGKEIDTYPNGFTKWVEKNQSKIASSKSLPYFVKYNKDAVKEVLTKEEPKEKSNIQSVADAVGVEVGKPMTFKKADEKHPNPHFEEDEQYRVNCQSAVVAYEMRRRGLPVEAFGRVENSMGDLLSYNTTAAWVDANGKMPTRIVSKQTKTGRMVDERGYVRNKYTTSGEVLHDFLSRTSEVGRYHVSWRWDGGNKGHIITMETFADGSRLFYDPQTGLMAKNIIPWAGNNMANFDLRARGLCAYRVDNLQPNPLVVKGVIKKAGSMAATPMASSEQLSWWRENAEGVTSVKGSFDSIKLSDVQYKSEKGGNISVNANRLENANKSKQEFKKFKKEHNMCRVLADNGYNIEMLEEKPGVSSSDILINGMKADLKSTRSAANIVKYAKKAVQKQDSELVIFEFENMTDEIHKELNKLILKGIHGMYYINGTYEVHTF